MLKLVCPLCRAEHPLVNFFGDIQCTCGKAVFSYSKLKWSLTEQPKRKMIPVIKMEEPDPSAKKGV